MSDPFVPPSLDTRRQRLHNEEDTLEDYLETITEIEGATRRAAEVIIDLQDKGPLYHYLVSVRADAVEALRDLVRAEPTGAAAIAALQVRARNFTNVCQWINSCLEEGELADRHIQEHYDDGR